MFSLAFIPLGWPELIILAVLALPVLIGVIAAVIVLTLTLGRRSNDKRQPTDRSEAG